MLMTVNDLKEYYSANFLNLVKKVYRSCGNYHDAEDVVQEAFERAIKYIDTCKDMDRWFKTILRNTYKDYVKNLMSWPVTKPLEDHTNDIEPIVVDQTRPALFRQVMKLVNKERLPNRLVLTLHIQYGFTEGEINNLVEDISVSKIRNIISYFKGKLIKSMQ